MNKLNYFRFKNKTADKKGFGNQTPTVIKFNRLCSGLVAKPNQLQN